MNKSVKFVFYVLFVFLGFSSSEMYIRSALMKPINLDKNLKNLAIYLWIKKEQLEKKKEWCENIIGEYMRIPEYLIN